MLIMKKSNPLSRNLATVLLIGSIGMTASAQKVPTDPPIVNQISPEKKSEGHQKNYNSSRESIDEKGEQSGPDTTVMQPRKETGADEHLLTVVQVETSDREAFETSSDGKAGTGSFLITRDGDLSHPLDVYYHLSGSAVNGEDYLRLNGAVTIARGQESVQVTVQALEDEEAEGMEEVVLTLADIVCIAIFPPPPSCYQIGKKNTAKLQVFDVERRENLAPKSVLITPKKHHMFQLPSALSISGEAMDPDGWISAFQFSTNSEILYEEAVEYMVTPESGQRQHFHYQWQEPRAGIYEITLAVTDNEGVTTFSRPTKIVIMDHQDLPELTVFSKDMLASETADSVNAKTNTAMFRVRRTGSTDAALEVSYQVSGSAANGIDYKELSGALTIEPGQRWGSVVVNPLRDDIQEERETVILSLLPSAKTYSIGESETARVLIMEQSPGPDTNKFMQDGSIHMRLPWVAGENFLLEVSENLRDWDVLDHGVTSDNALDIIESPTQRKKEKYFRIRKALKAVEED